MSDEGVSLRDALLDALGSGYETVGKIEQNRTTQGTDGPYVWYQKSSDLVDHCLDGSVLSREIVWDIESVSQDIDESVALAADIKSALDGYSGAIGDIWAMEVHVIDNSDNYVPRSIGTAEGLHVAALQISILAA